MVPFKAVTSVVIFKYSNKKLRKNEPVERTDIITDRHGMVTDRQAAGVT